MSQSAAQGILSAAPLGNAVEDETAANAFLFPDLTYLSLNEYSLWACQARHNGIPILPLEAVATELRECSKKPSSDSCHLTVRNKFLSRPADFVPKTVTRVTTAPIPVINHTPKCTAIAVFQPKAPYPEELRSTRQSGAVTVMLSIRPDGTVSNARIVGSAMPEFSQSAMATTANWRFKPLTCGDPDAGIRAQVEIKFSP
jgi:TonB family protein